jgi:ubiquinone/menaquinone biosynthesis C-methylase UbiE
MNSWLKREQRRINKAQILLRPGVEGAGGIWADLGCGDGIFTYVLGQFLRPDSEIYAIDKNRRALAALKRNLAELQLPTAVHPMLADFTHLLDLPPLDGLVMANALHFIKAKEPVLQPLLNLLRPGGRLIVIEYNTNRGNYAVPYPLDETAFLALARRVGLRGSRIVARTPSTFLGEMYTGLGLAAHPNSCRNEQVQSS